MKYLNYLRRRLIRWYLIMFRGGYDDFDLHAPYNEEE